MLSTDLVLPSTLPCVQLSALSQPASRLLPQEGHIPNMLMVEKNHASGSRTTQSDKMDDVHGGGMTLWAWGRGGSARNSVDRQE